jgi:hypothetical protein
MAMDSASSIDKRIFIMRSREDVLNRTCVSLLGPLARSSVPRYCWFEMEGPGFPALPDPTNGVFNLH